jgi:hypothetical protein
MCLRSPTAFRSYSQCPIENANHEMALMHHSIKYVGSDAFIPPVIILASVLSRVLMTKDAGFDR